MPRECASCCRGRELWCRGLCKPCVARCRRNGTLADYGYVKADRLADYALRRSRGTPLSAAAIWVGVSVRTAWRYEAELRDTRSAGWPGTRRAA